MYKNLILSLISVVFFTACGGSSSSEDLDITDPIITSVSEINVDENQTEVLTVNASDASSLTFSLSGTDANSFDIDNTSGVITFKVAPDYETKSLYEVTVTVKDSMGNSATQNINININNLDDIGPVFTSSSQITVDEKQTSAYTAIATDESTPITYAISGTDASSFNINSTSGVITFITAPNDEQKSSYSIVVTASDSIGNNTTQNVTITINNIDNLDQTAPLITSTASVSVDENQTTALTVVATDSSSLSYSISGTDASSFNINSATGVITFKTAPDFETKSSYSFVATATDSASNKTDQNITININDLDEIAPVFTSASSISVNENQTSALTLVVTDSSSLSYSISGTDASSFNIDSATGVITFKTAPDFETKSSYSFVATATDSASNKTDQTVTININDLDEIAPVFTSASSVNVDENQITVLTVIATDASNSIIYSVSGDDGSSFNIDSATGVITFKAIPDYETKVSYLIKVTASDNSFNNTEQTITIILNDVDEISPVITSSSSINIDENQSNVLTVVATDASNSITYSLHGTDSSSFEIDSTTGVITFKNTPDYEIKNSYVVIVRATDSASNKTDQNITININDLDEINPVITSIESVSVDENQTTALTVVATDSSSLSYSISGTDASSFNIDSATGVITFKTAPDFETKSSYSFVATATDSASNKTDQNITININDLDEIAPVFTSASSISVNENQTSALTLVATDASNMITYSLSGADASSFNIDSDTGIVTFKVEADYESKTSYTIIATAQDDSNNSTNQTVVINIIDLEDVAPVFTSSSTVSVDENQISALTVTASDASSITYTISGTDASSFNINSTSGVITFKNAPDYETKNSYSISVLATDDNTNSSSQSITININDLDDTAPVFTSSNSVSVDENQTSALTVVATDSSTPIVYSLNGTDASSFDIDSSTGVITFKTAPDYETKNSYSIVATATDSVSNSTNETITISINNLEDTAPEVSTSNPINNQVNLAIDTNLTVTFSESMDETTITNQNITLEKSINSELLSAVVTYDDGTKTVTINPDNDFVDGTLYKLTVSINVKDISNNALAQAKEISFMVGDGIIHEGFAYKNITSPITGKTWLDRNLGSQRACLNSTDEKCFGDFYQWGRKADGHEKLTSLVTASKSTDVATVGNSFFITSVQSADYDWVPGDEDGSLRIINWGKTNGTFICPVGYKVPTDTELGAETVSKVGPDVESTGHVKVIDANSAFTNFLKLPLAGYRDFGTGDYTSKDSIGFVWTRGSNANNVSTSIYFGGSSAGEETTSYRANGFSVRCIKN